MRASPVVHFPPRSRKGPDVAGLIADYTLFERRRAERRPFVNGLGGLAGVTLLGAGAGRLPVPQALLMSAVLATPPLFLVILNRVQRRRLVRRLERVRALQTPRKL